jgi:DNA mismatch repair protein MutS
LQVAALAGVPREVIGHARRYLEELERARDQRGTPAAQAELPLVVAAPDPRIEALVSQLEAADPDRLSPREALETLYRLRQFIKD